MAVADVLHLFKSEVFKLFHLIAHRQGTKIESVFGELIRHTMLPVGGSPSRSPTDQ